jgi:hydroxymethylbilane synthase
VFVKEVQAALLDGRADIAVHSAKDLPAQTPPGLCLACVPEREDPRDGLLGASLEDLPVGAAVATGSVRRRAQLAWLRPDLTFVELRGNMAARVAHAEAVGAGIVAVAGLQRLGLGHRITQILEPSTMLPQVAQGALALECREDDDATRVWLAAIDNPGIHRAVRAERAFLDALGGGCTLPVGALATALSPDSSGPELVLEGLLATRDGHVVLRRRRQGSDPEALGRNVAGELLDDCGGRFLGDWSGGAG